MNNQFPAQAESDLNAQALTLGAPGLSFSYAQTFGITSEPYLADTIHLNSPNGLFIDASNTLFVTEESGARVLAYDPAGVNTMTLGHAGQPWGHDDFLSTPKDVAKDAAGNIWIVFNYAALKEFDPTGATVIQSYPATNNWEQDSTNDHFNDPRGIAFDAAGLMYISDGNNHRIQVYDVSGSTPAYLRTIGTTGTAQSNDTGFNYPGKIAFDSLGRLYVVDTNNYRVQRCTFGVDWTCSTFFGETGVLGSDLIHLDWTDGITINGSDDIFIADSQNFRVLKCTTSAVCALFAGESGVAGTDTDHFAWTADVAVDSSGNVFVSDYGNYRVQKFNSAGVYQSTIGVTGVSYVTDNTHFNKPWGIAIAPDNSMYIFENGGYRLIKLNSSGVFQWSVGEAGVYGSDNAHFGNWWGGVEGSPSIDANGRIYVGDTGNNRVQIFNANGSYYATLGSWGTGNYEFSCPTEISISPINGDIYVTDRCNHRIQVFTSSRVYKTTLGVTDTPGSDNLHFNYPYGVTVDKSGNIYVGDGDNYRIQKCILTVSAPGYACSTFAGETGVSGDDFGHLGNALSVKVDTSGRVYVADEWNSRIQVFDSSGAYLTTIADNWGTSNSSLINPSGVALDSDGNVYVTDRDNHRIQKFTIGTPGWEQSNINGFGERETSMASMTPFKGQLYAGTYKYSQYGAQIWRSSDGKNWTEVVNNGFGVRYNIGIDHMIEFNGKLYAGTWNSTPNSPYTDTGGEIWRSSDGTTWEPVVQGGFDSADNNGIMRMAVFNGKLYAGTWTYSTTYTRGAEIWRSDTGDAGTWTKVVNNGLGDSTNDIVMSMETFNGYLYAGTHNWNYVTKDTTGSKIWRTADGVTWTEVVGNGFGNMNSYFISLAAFGDSLYYAGVGSWLPTDEPVGGQVWKCTAASGCDTVSDWTQVTGNGFGNPQNHTIASMRVFANRLYLATVNSTTGMEVWQTDNGTDWLKVGSKGFGDGNNDGTYWDNSMTVFNNNLFIGTTNGANGGEIWSMVLPPATPVSITRASANPTAAASVNFTVNFSNSVTGVDASDFKLTSTTLMGASITSVSGANSTYTVMVNTGTGNGTIRLDILGTANIQSFVGPYTGGETYAINKNTAPTVPVLKSPANNALVTSNPPPLDWNDSTQVMALANDWSYEISVTDMSLGTNQTFNTASGLSNSSYTFTSPLPANTTFSWKVRAYNDNNQYSAWSATRTFRTKPETSATKLAAPVLNLPADGTTENNKRPTFEWGAVNGATTYTLQILSGVKVVNTGTIKAPTHVYTPTVDLLPGATYTWKVKANGLISSDPSATFTFTTSENPPKSPTLSAPSAGALVDSALAQTLKWNLVSAIVTPFSPLALSYEVEVATNSAFSGSTSTTVADIKQSLPIGTLSPNRIYYWHVRSWSGAGATGNHSAWSAVRTFRTRLAMPVLNLPSDTAMLDNKRPTFSWDEAPGAASYTVQILSGTKVVNTGTIKAPAYTYTPAKDLLPGIEYQWKVKANGANAGDYSLPFSFTTSVNPPKTPTLSEPLNGALVDSTVAQILKWKPVFGVPTTNPATTYPDAASYEVEYATNSVFTNSTILPAAGVNLNIGTLLPGRTYYWRVRAWSGVSATGNHSAWSLARTIKVKFVAPTLTTPTNNATGINVRPTFTWSSVNGLWTSYTLQVAPTNAFGKGMRSFTIPAPLTSYTIPDKLPALMNNAPYCWRVKINGLYFPVLSSTLGQCFTTAAP